MNLLLKDRNRKSFVISIDSEGCVNILSKCHTDAAPLGLRCLVDGLSTQMPPLWGLDALQNRGYKPLPQAKMNTSCQKLYTP